MNNLPLVVVVYTHYWFFQQPESLNVGKSKKYFHFLAFTMTVKGQFCIVKKFEYFT